MVEQLVPDDLWALIQPVIPSPPPRPRGGRPRQCARQTLAGIVYLLRWG
ncbi:transposase, partial [Deinococcus radiotolerans]